MSGQIRRAFIIAVFLTFPNDIVARNVQPGRVIPLPAPAAASISSGKISPDGLRCAYEVVLPDSTGALRLALTE